MGSFPFLAGNYDYRLLAISVFISILAAFAALDLAERVTTARGGSRPAWLYGGACAMGIGIWAMHYMGMAAFHFPLPVLYDWPTVLVSLLTAILASGVALFIVSRSTMGPIRLAAGSVIMGSGIASMHYIGMAAMRLKAICIYSPALVALSVLLAIAISWVALQLAFAGRRGSISWDRRKLGSGLIMGAAIPIVHYAGMAAVSLDPRPSFNGSLSHSVAITQFGIAAIVAATAVIFGHVYMISIVSRRFSRQAEQLMEKGAELRAIFDSLIEGVIVLDTRDNLIQINPAATRILGLPENIRSLDSTGETLQVRTVDGSLVPVDQWPSKRALRGEFVKNCELEIQSLHTGQSTVVEIGTTPVVNASGERVQVILTYREVTERRQTDEARARLAAIVESSQDAIIGKELNGIVTSWNNGAEKIFGYKAEEMIGQSIQRLLPAGHEHEEDGILDRIRHGESLEQLETTRRRRDGTLVQVSLMISPIRDSNGNVVGASKIARDITEKRLLERQLRQSQKMEAIGQLTGGIAHDFNNLLAIVIGNLSLLERLVAGNEDALDRLRPVQKAAARGADLTRRLLALASKEDLNPGSIRLDEAVHETLELAGRALGPEIKILTYFDSSLPAVYVDPSGLESALLNLTVNARDAMPKGGTVTISTQLSSLDESFPPVQAGELKPGAYARISVSDTGHGMSKETLERALEPFFTTKSRNKGTGLGLSMVYGFARQSGGTVRLYSEEGYGTTVSLFLPLAGEFSKEMYEIPAEHFSADRSVRVLVVDDELELLEIAHAYLMEMGHSALLAHSGASALKTIAQHPDIELMITDIIMPGGMNGVELAEKARQLRPGLKVVYSSGFPADALADRNGTKIDGLMLRKPYQRTEFTVTIQRALHRPESYQPNDDRTQANTNH